MKEEAVAAVIAGARFEGRSEAVIESWQKDYDERGMGGFWNAVAESEGGIRKPDDMAGNYALIGEKDLAFEWLEKAYELPIHPLFLSDPRFDSLRSDARSEQLLRKLNLPEEAIQRHLALND